MNEPLPRLMFVPVSGPFGMGEYARSLSIAQGVLRRRPCAAIQFVLSREAPYAAESPFPATLLPSSPTFHSAAVIEAMRQWRPDVVIFDNAGRTRQLRAARRLGARVVYISARRRQRNKAFRLSWMRLIDEHWMAYPEFIAGKLGRIERLKRSFIGRPAIRHLDVVLARDHGPGTGGAKRESLLARIGRAADGYVLVVPGGGTGHPGANDAVERFLHAARELAAGGIDTVFVGRAGTASDLTESQPAGSRPRMLGSLPQADLAELMRGARLVIANGGSTLLQSIACGRACIAVPIARDQAERIRRCVEAGVAIAAPLEPAAIVKLATELSCDEAGRHALAARARALGLRDGVEIAVDAILGLLHGK